MREARDLRTYLRRVSRKAQDPSREIKANDRVFKSKTFKRYVQTRVALINGSAKVIAIATDVTSIKEFEKHGKKLRSMFFSSVAHELRTPLNSIIPIVKMVIANVDRLAPGMHDTERQRLLKYLTIILNSALHLESVIEDALDISRLENNKFNIFEDVFSLRDAVEEVSQIMRFQISEKGLQLITEIGTRVPPRVLND